MNNKKSVCSWCDKKITIFKDKLSVKEFGISGFCQSCQDITFHTTRKGKLGKREL